MATLSRQTIQRLAVLHTLSKWQRGAYGPVRVQKTLFFADQANDPLSRFFTFRKYYLGQYSREISDALNALRDSGRLKCVFAGPAERLQVTLSTESKQKIAKLFRQRFPKWEKGLKQAFLRWAYLRNDDLLNKAHDDPAYTQAQHDQIIFESSLPDEIDIPLLDEESAEKLTDLVDERLAKETLKRMLQAVKTPAKNTNWRERYFDEVSCQTTR